MLHLIFQSPITNAVLQRIDSGDDVFFLENAVFPVIKNSLLSVDLEQMLKNKVHLYVLDNELKTRGINSNELIVGVKVTDYSGLVKLTERNKLINSWN